MKRSTVIAGGTLFLVLAGAIGGLAWYKWRQIEKGKQNQQHFEPMGTVDLIDAKEATWNPTADLVGKKTGANEGGMLARTPPHLRCGVPGAAGIRLVQATQEVKSNIHRIRPDGRDTTQCTLRESISSTSLQQRYHSSKEHGVSP